MLIINLYIIYIFEVKEKTMIYFLELKVSHGCSGQSSAKNKFITKKR